MVGDGIISHEGEILNVSIRMGPTGVYSYFKGSVREGPVTGESYSVENYRCGIEQRMILGNLLRFAHGNGNCVT